MFPFVLLFGFALALPQGSDCPHTELITCLLNHMDIDHNGSINSTEVNNYMLEQPCGLETSVISGPRMLMYCDMNENGVLDENDYYNATGCMKTLGFQRMLCIKCRNCII